MILENMRAPWRALALGAAGLALAGCMGPTYGTGKSQGAQLIEDLDNIVSFRAESQEITYEPRPELVEPENKSILPPPQQPAAAEAGAWPESPEARRARLASSAQRVDERSGMLPAEFAASQKEGLPRQQIGAASAQAAYDRDKYHVLTPAELNEGGAAFRKRVAESYTRPTERRYLSEPPVAYRQPAATAPVGDPGVDEDVKESQRGRGESLGQKVRDLLPF